MTPRPSPPHMTVPPMPMTHRATIRRRNGRWFRYVVYRTAGIGLPEKCTTMHRTLKGARRAANRWRRKTYGGELVEKLG